MGVNPSGSKPSPTSLLFLSLFSTDPLLTSDARTYLTGTLFSNPVLLPYLVLFLFSSPPLLSLSHTLIFCPSRTITPIVRPRWHLRHRLLIAFVTTTPSRFAHTHRRCLIAPSTSVTHPLPCVNSRLATNPTPCALSIALGVEWRKT